MSDIIRPETSIGTASPALSGEVIPAEAIIMGHIGLPEGFTPGRPIPAGFILQAALTSEELRDPRKSQAFIQEGRRLRYVYGGSAVCAEANTQPGWQHVPEAIAVASFMRYDAQALSRLTRLRRAASRFLFGARCDVNF